MPLSSTLPLNYFSPCSTVVHVAYAAAVGALSVPLPSLTCLQACGLRSVYSSGRRVAEHLYSAGFVADRALLPARIRCCFHGLYLLR